MDRQTRIKKMFYGWDDEMDIMRDIQKCQRNWDYSKEVHHEIRDYLLWTALNAPSKQHEAYYDVYWSTDRDVIQECSRYTWGCTHSRNPPSTWRNAQANANMYMLFVAKEPDTNQNCNADGTEKSNKSAARWENAYVSIGIAVGLVLRAAANYGFATGCNKSHGDLNGDKFWEKKLGILEEVEAGTKKIAYGIGIGYPNEHRPRWESDDLELALGAGNGSNLATDTNLKENEKGKPYRHIKIINAAKHAGETLLDPYGNEHEIPDVAEIKINTMRKRNIEAIEIK